MYSSTSSFSEKKIKIHKYFDQWLFLKKRKKAFQAIFSNVT